MYIEVVRGTEKGGSPSIFNETMLNAIKQILGHLAENHIECNGIFVSILKSQILWKIFRQRNHQILLTFTDGIKQKE